MKHHGRLRIPALLWASALLLHGFSAQGANETVQGMLAAQIRTQGFTCDKLRGASRDAKLSRPDYDVWVLTCSNATYRVGRFPDMSAKVQQLR